MMPKISKVQKNMTILMIILLIGAMCSIFLYNHLQKTDMLSAVHDNIEQQYPEVNHLNAEDFLDIDKSEFVVLDVRERDEFDVSHIDGAIRISPDASGSDVIDKISDIARGKDVIFYCSVGVRSSILADKSREQLNELGVRGVYNLTGGLFQWHNEGRTMVNASGETPFIHPFDSIWGKLVQRQDFIKTTP